MPARPNFRLYHSNALDVLAGLLAEELRRPVPGQSPLQPDVVLIPQAAMRRWLQATLAQAHGIAANLEFLTPGEFVQRALNANVAGAAEDLSGKRHQPADVVARGKLRNHPAIGLVHRDLAVDCMGEQGSSPGVVQCDARLVAGGFDAQYQHGPAF